MHLTDFSDRLSPMLVKELRQGLRTRAFIGVFLALQIFLAIILLSAGVAASSDNAGDTISRIIFMFFSIAVLIIQPMRGITALSSEVKGNTIDMMVLTRLSAWKIVAGKWSAIVSQSALLLVTIIPYLILRYFFGGMNLLGEIVMLALLFFSSATLTAFTVGISASSSVILRSILPLLALPLGVMILMSGVIFGGGGNELAELCALETKESRIGVAMFLLAGTYCGYFMLSIGTSLIAPYAENHSTLRRMIALALTVAAAVICSIPSIVDSEIFSLIFFIIFGPIFLISLSEFSTLVPPIYEKFSKYGPLGKIAAIFLCPGWPSGLFFCSLLSIIAAIPYFVNRPAYANDEYITISIILLASLLFPAFLINLFKTKGPTRVSNYILFFVASFFASAILMGVAESLSNRDFMWLFIWVPPALLFMSEQSRFDDGAVSIASIVITTIFLLSLFTMAVIHYRKSLTEIEQSKT